MGEFFADEIHGLGQLLNAQGEVLDPGPWEHNVSQVSDAAPSALGARPRGAGLLTAAPWQYTPYPINGNGKYEFPDGSFYDGDWQDGLLHGHGTFSWKSSGDQYTGAFRRGQMHGSGRYVFRNGDVFEGEFVDGKPVGRGQYVWARENQAYRGEWADGVQHGGARPPLASAAGVAPSGSPLRLAEGTHFYDLDLPQEGLRYEGGWDQGRQHGPGTLAVGDHRVQSTWLEGRNDQVGRCGAPAAGTRPPSPRRPFPRPTPAGGHELLPRAGPQGCAHVPLQGRHLHGDVEGASAPRPGPHGLRRRKHLRGG